MSELGDVAIPFWVVILAVVAVCACIICGCACFTVRCFSPENHLGPETEVNTEGKRWIRTPNSISPWLAYESDQDPRGPVAGGPVGPVGPRGAPRPSPQRKVQRGVEIKVEGPLSQ